MRVTGDSATFLRAAKIQIPGLTLAGAVPKIDPLSPSLSPMISLFSRPFLPLVFSAGAILLPSAGAVDFKEEVRPILNKKCFKCHTGPKAKGSLRMDTPEDFSKRVGGDDPAIIPGDPGKSLLSIKAGLPASDGDAMPPPAARSRGSEPMTAAELAVVRQWIAEGAKFEAGATPSEAPAAAMKPKLRAWSNSAGAALQAAFVSFDGTTVTLQKEDGSRFTYPFANLSPESQALAKQLAGQ